MNTTTIVQSGGRPTRPARKGTAVALGVLLGLFWLIVIGWWILFPLLRDDGEAVPLEEGQGTPEAATTSTAAAAVGTANESSADTVAAIPDNSVPSVGAERQAPELVAVAEVSLPGTAAVPEETVPSSMAEEAGDSPSRAPDYAAALEGTFVAVLVSAESEAAAERARARLEREQGRAFGILLSDDFASLNPGYWVVYAGPYATGTETQTACWWELDRRSGAECYGRRLSQDPADRDSVYGPSPD